MASANAMTWLDQTSMAKNLAHSPTLESKPTSADFPHRLSEATEILLSAGTPMDLVAEWLKQKDLSAAGDLQKHFAEFVLKRKLSSSKPRNGQEPTAQ